MSHAVKRADLRTANTQTIVSKVGTIITKCTENLIQVRKTDGKDIDLDEMVGFQGKGWSGFKGSHSDSGGTSLQTTSKGPLIHKSTGEISTSQKTRNSPSTKRREARTKCQCQWTGESGNPAG